MVLRFRKGVRIFWNTADSLAVVGRTTRIFRHPSIEVERILAAFEKGIPAGELTQLAHMIDVSEEKLAELKEELADWLVADNSKRICKRETELGALAEATQFELESGDESGSLAERRSNWAVLLSGSRVAISAIAPLLRASGVEYRFSNRGVQIPGSGSTRGDWMLSHRLGTISSKVKQLSIGFFQEELDPIVTRYWMSKSQSHMAVIFRQGGVAVSRIIEPGKTPCLECDSAFEKLGGVSRASLHFQVLHSRMSFDSARMVSIANAEVLQRVLNLIDFDEAATETWRHGSWEQSQPSEFSDCGCLIDSFEAKSAQESGWRDGSFQTVNF